MTKHSVQKVIIDLHTEIVRCLDVSGAAFQRLRYEGAQNAGANLKAVSCALRALVGSLMPEMLLEEDEIFPYISRHIPRFEAMLYYFRSEHEEFREKLRLLKERVDSLMKSPAKQRAELNRIYFEALYLVSHLKTHIQNEKDRLYVAIDDEMHEREKKTLLERIDKALCGGRVNPEAWKGGPSPAEGA